MATIRESRRPGAKFWSVTLASVLLLIGLVGGLAIRSALATHGGGQTVHACVSRFTGQARIILPGLPPNCTANEVRVDWTSASGDAPAAEVSEATIGFGLAAGQTVTRDVSCPNDGEIAISGGGFANLVGDIPTLTLNQSFRVLPDTWRVSMTNLDENGDSGAFVQVLCIPAS